MALSVNLLPWRYVLRQRRQRYRISIMVSLVVVLLGGYGGARVLLHQQIKALHKQGNELENQQKKLEEVVSQQYEPAVSRKPYRGQEQRHSVLRWETLLTNLANKLPENSWLKMLNWQSSQLVLEGYTSEIDDLEIIEKVLKQLPGTFQIQSGPVSYLREQGLAYRFIMEDTGGVLVSP